MPVTGEKLRDYAGPVTNTDIWDSFELRTDDVIVSTPPKCGTTWTLNIVMMLIHGRVVPDADNHRDAPWLDCAFRDRKAIAAQQAGLTRRRCLKTHTPLDGIAYAAEPTYIVVYRHPLDAHFSYRSHVANMKDGSVGLIHMFPDDIAAGVQRFVTAPPTASGTDDLSLASIAHHFHAARQRQSRGNVHFFHYADLTRDLRGQIARLAGIMGLSFPATVLDDLAEANTFAAMRRVMEMSDQRFADSSPFIDQAEFFASGSSNKWEGRLPGAAITAFDRRCAELLSDDDAAWLKWGDRGHP